MTRFEELLSLLIDESASSDEIDELIVLCKEDPNKSRELREQLHLSDLLSQYESELRDENLFIESLSQRSLASDTSDSFVENLLKASSDNSKQNVPIPQVNPDKSSSLAISWTVTGTLLVALLIVLVSTRSTDSASKDPDTPEVYPVDSGVAVLTRAMFAGNAEKEKLTEGMTIPPGPLTWEDGVIQLDFYCGATVVVEGPANLEIVNEMQVILNQGRLRAEVSEQAKGFTVLAPTVELVDLGTEFAMEVQDSQSTFVHVIDGLVEVYNADTQRDQKTRRELTAGQSIVVDMDGQSLPVERTNHDFIDASQLGEIYQKSQHSRLQAWQEFHQSIRSDGRIIAYFPFEKGSSNRRLDGFGSKSSTLNGAIVGCNWTEGRWPGKMALEFKSPGDRVRINIPGEYESVTWTAWVRIDATDRLFNSLLLTDGFEPMRPHWQVHRDGTLVLGVQHDEKIKEDYSSDPFIDFFGLGRWTHLATVYDNSKGEVRHYINGRHAKTLPLATSPQKSITFGNTTIGNWTNPSTKKQSSQKPKRSYR